MKLFLPTTIMLLLLATSAGKAQPAPSPDAEAFFTKAMSQINPKHVAWVKSTGKTANEKKMSEAAIRESAKKYALLGSMNGQDIEALCFLVMMQASKSAQEDLKAIMANVKNINNEKQALQNAMTRMNDSKQNITRLQLDSFKLLLNKAPVTKQANIKPIQTTRTATLDSSKNKRLMATSQPASTSDVSTVKEQLKNKLDSISEMNKTESLNLQATTDKQSQFVEMLSRILKAISETQNQIIKNLR